MIKASEPQGNFDPTEFMRTRRPELFPDTEIATDDEPPLDRLAFEFLLDQLTARKQEYQFEHFCRRLAEHELCPNLSVQTGPTGGGDRLVDAETYPVDQAIADRWYEGNQHGASERWGFAFSAKRAWRSKFRSDVEKIVGTGRDYKIIYFMTNQAVRDRTGAELEDEARTKYGVDIRILDRSWITDKVFTHKRWNLVYQTLEVQRPNAPSTALPGPLDTKRTQELLELDQMIDDPDRYDGLDYQLVEDCLQSALLARGLGKPRAEIDGRFERAERLARRVNLPTQLGRVLYNRAWTAFWWFNDQPELDRYYDEVEPLVIEAGTVWPLDDLVNLWQLGLGSSVGNPERSSAWKDRTNRLMKALELHASNKERPAGSLWAKTQICLMKLTLGLRQEESPVPVLKELRKIVKSVEGLLDYPVDTVARLVQELGPALGEVEAYDELFEALASLQASRVGRGQEGISRLTRGRQKLKNSDWIGAITQLAKAVVLLAHEEDKQDFFTAVTLSAMAYEACGLRWAARAHWVFALDRCLFEHQVSGKIAPQAVPVAKRLATLELELGRVPCSLLWADILRVIDTVVPISDTEAYEYDRLMLDAEIGLLLLLTPCEDWQRLEKIAGYLDYLHLPLARGAALFSMGHEDQYRLESGQADDDLEEFFSLWAHQPAAKQLPNRPQWFLDAPVAMSTQILGCHIHVEANNTSRTIVWSETILAFLEAFFCTALTVDGLWSLRPRLRLVVQEDQEQETSLITRRVEDECGEVHLLVSHSGVVLSEVRGPEILDDPFIHLLGMVAAELHLSGTPSWLEAFFANERAQDRAAFAASTILSINNVLGDDPEYEIARQIPDDVSERLECLRTETWTAGNYFPDVQEEGDENLKPGPRPNEARIERHDDVENISMINIPLWDKARWRGVFFASPLDPHHPPVLALMFEDGTSGTKILKSWRKELGDIDEREKLSVMIITGVDSHNPAYYRVAIGTNLSFDKNEVRPAVMFAMAWRSLEMTPQSTENLNRFLESYRQTGSYEIGAASITANGPQMDFESLIRKTELRVTPAWQVGPNDPAMAALKGVKYPIIPEEEEDAPISAIMHLL